MVLEHALRCQKAPCDRRRVRPRRRFGLPVHLGATRALGRLQSRRRGVASLMREAVRNRAFRRLFASFVIVRLTAPEGSKRVAMSIGFKPKERSSCSRGGV